MTLFALVRSRKRQHAGQAAGFAAVAIATAAFIGWWVSLPLLSSWGSGFANRETCGGLVSRGPRPRTHAPRQELAFGIRGWSGRWLPSLRSICSIDFGIDLGINRLKSLAGAAGCGAGI